MQHSQTGKEIQHTETQLTDYIVGNYVPWVKPWEAFYVIREFESEGRQTPALDGNDSQDCI